MNIHDQDNNNIVQLKDLDGAKIGVSQCLSFIDEHNSRAPKIISNCLRNVSKKTCSNEFAPIKPEIYTNKIPLKAPGTRTQHISEFPPTPDY